SEAGRERADAAQANRHADVRDRVVGVAQERGGPLQAAGQQVLVRRLPEGAAELAAEVGRREVGRPRERLHVEALAVAGVDQVLGTQEVPGRGDGLHAAAAPPSASGRSVTKATAADGRTSTAS